MTRIARILGLLLLAALLAGAASACNGDGGNGDGETPAATATGPAPTAAETDEVEPTDDDGASSGDSPFESYHYVADIEFSITGTETDTPAITGAVEGDFVAPDRHSFTSRFEFGGISGTESFIIIGDDAWIRVGAGTWERTTRSDPAIQDAADLTSLDPDFFDSGDLQGDLAALDSEEVELNGVQTRRYHIPRGAIDTLAALFGEEFLEDAEGLRDFEMTVWLEEETGALVKAEVIAEADPSILDTGAPFDIPPDATILVSLSLELMRINDDSITIEPPI